jgi:hypothetical protein
MIEHWLGLEQPALGESIALLRDYLGAGKRPLARRQLTERICEIAGRDLGLTDASIFRWETGRNGMSPFYRRLLGTLCEQEMAAWEMERQHRFLVELGHLAGSRKQPESEFLTLRTMFGEALESRRGDFLGRGRRVDESLLEEAARFLNICSRHAQREVSRALFVVVRRHLDSMTRLMGNSLTDSLRRHAHRIASQTAVLAGRLAFLRQDREQAAAHLSLGATLAKDIGDDQTRALALIFASDLYSTGALLGALPGASSVAVTMLDRAADLGSSEWPSVMWTLLHWFRAEAHCFLGSELASSRDLDSMQRHQAGLGFSAGQLAGDMVIPDVEIPWISSIGPALLAGTLSLASGRCHEAMLAFSQGLADTSGQARGNRLSGLAAAYALSGEAEMACVLLKEAISERVARRHPTQICRAEAVRWRYLSAWNAEAAVQELDDQFTKLALETTGHGVTQPRPERS